MRKEIFGFLFFLCLFSLVATVNAISITQIETGTLSSARGTAAMSFDGTGRRLFTVDNWHGAKPNFMSVYGLNDATDVSTLYFIEDINLTTFFPTQYQNYSISTGYFTEEGNELYIVLQNESNDFNTAAAHNAKYALLRLSFCANFYTACLNYTESYDLGTFIGSTYTAPGIFGLIVSPNGSTLMISGRWRLGSDNSPKIAVYTLPTAYNISSMTPGGVSPWLYSISAYSSFGSYYNLFGTPDFAYLFFIERDIQSGQHQIYAASRNISNGSIQSLGLLNREGLTVYYTFTNTYLFAQSGGTLYKYQLNNVTLFQSNDVLINSTDTGTSNSWVYLNLINPLLRVFPDHRDLTFKQRMGTVFLVMLLTVIIILFAASSFTTGIHPIILYIITILLVVEFLFFVAIQYIPIGFFVTLILIVIAIAYLAVRSKGGS